MMKKKKRHENANSMFTTRPKTHSLSFAWRMYVEQITLLKIQFIFRNSKIFPRKWGQLKYESFIFRRSTHSRLSFRFLLSWVNSIQLLFLDWNFFYIYHWKRCELQKVGKKAKHVEISAICVSGWICFYFLSGWSE